MDGFSWDKPLSVQIKKERPMRKWEVWEFFLLSQENEENRIENDNILSEKRIYF